MDTDKIIRWEGIISLLASMGVKTGRVIRDVLKDAGEDDVTIMQLTVKWDDLYNRVKKASGR